MASSPTGPTSTGNQPGKGAREVAHLSDGLASRQEVQLGGGTLLVVLEPNRIIRKRTDVNCSSFHIRVFLGLSNPQEQRQTSTLCISHDNFGKRKAKFNLGMSMTTQM
jgi:hypothetical protein